MDLWFDTKNTVRRSVLHVAFELCTDVYFVYILHKKNIASQYA